MMIKCNCCGAAYDPLRSGDCPNCGSDSSSLHTTAARRIETKADLSTGDHGWGAHLNQRAERLSHEKKPSFMRMMLPYLKIIIVVFAVAMSGTLLIRFAEISSAREPTAGQSESGEVKPPIRELADATFNARFNPLKGVRLTVTATGTLDPALLGGQLRKEEHCVFVHLAAQVESREELGDYFTPPYLVCDGQIIRPVDLRGTADLASYTPFEYGLLKERDTVEGQLFFILPLETDSFSLRYSGGEGIEQETRLHL